MKVLKTIFAFLMLPLVLISIYELIILFLNFAIQSNMAVAPFWIGVIVYFLFQVIFFKPMRTYVFGHELTHAITGLLSGAQIKKIKVLKNSGSVTLTKDSILISLAPYFIPFYSLIIIIAYLALGWFTDPQPFYPYYLFLSGFALSFHFALTFYAVTIGQEDLKTYGVFFSFVFICFINCIIISLILILIFPQYIKLNNFFNAVVINTFLTYKYILMKISHLFNS
ncbi:MAG: hypothetical protein PHR82_07270 [Endomicrobiaceae bacterium]|nr:hypothetical protein [Endomicrobiaceae bacterium]